MTASANYHYQCPTRNHLMVVCGMPYRYAVSYVDVVCKYVLLMTERGDDDDVENDYVDNTCI